MNMTLLVALIIPWVFWSLLTGFLIAAGRSWINMLLIPTCITVVILAIAGLSSIQSAFRTSLILHAFLFVFLLGSYIAFVLRERQ